MDVHLYLYSGDGIFSPIVQAFHQQLLAELRRNFPSGGGVGYAYLTKAHNICSATNVIYAIGCDFATILGVSAPDADREEDLRWKNARRLLKEAYTWSL